MKIDAMIAVLQAAKEGKAIERTNQDCDGQWRRFRSDLFAAEWDFYRWNYRVKPEPREFWITLGGQVWLNESDARRWFRNDEEYAQKVIHVREDVSSVTSGKEKV